MVAIRKLQNKRGNHITRPYHCACWLEKGAGPGHFSKLVSVHRRQKQEPKIRCLNPYLGSLINGLFFGEAGPLPFPVMLTWAVGAGALGISARGSSVWIHVWKCRSGYFQCLERPLARRTSHHCASHSCRKLNSSFPLRVFSSIPSEMHSASWAFCDHAPEFLVVSNVGRGIERNTPMYHTHRRKRIHPLPRSSLGMRWPAGKDSSSPMFKQSIRHMKPATSTHWGLNNTV